MRATLTVAIFAGRTKHSVPSPAAAKSVTGTSPVHRSLVLVTMTSHTMEWSSSSWGVETTTAGRRFSASESA
jgi:hypothetical protein